MRLQLSLKSLRHFSQTGVYRLIDTGRVNMELSIREENSHTVFIVKGKIDWAAARTLDRKVTQYLNDGKSNIVFILDEVTFVCSGAIGVLVFNLNKAKEKGGALFIIANNEYINSIFDTLKFDIVFDGLLYKTYKDFRRDVVQHNHFKKYAS